MKNVFKTALSLLLCLTMLLPAALTITAEDNQDMYATWVATDDLGRTTPMHEEAGDKREDTAVGIFYFMFMDNPESQDIVDFSKYYEQAGAQGVWNAAVTNGFHIWAEPYLGYYLNTDEWVYRKHAYLLDEAGVDFVYLDVTNSSMYPHAWRTMFRTWQSMRDEGSHTPQIVFCFGQGIFADNMKVIWNDIYTPDENGNYPYEDLWFHWEGKPLLLASLDSLSDAEKKTYGDFFTIRKSWAYNTTDTRGEWPWIQEHVQTPGKSPDGKVEQMAVAAGFHANSSHGRSWVITKQDARRVQTAQTVNGKLDFGYSLEETAQGLAFAQQWEAAIKERPSVVMLTGWNEFTFGKWATSLYPSQGIGQTVASMYKVTQYDPVYDSNYIDAMTAEYSRDIEPINGQFGDNYFYEMAEYIRLYKGVSPLPGSTAAFDVDMSGDLSEFNAIPALYLDTKGDTAHRDGGSIGSLYRYVNTTGRNDLLEARVSKTGKTVYFSIDCADTVITDDGADWMNLYLNVDRSCDTGWEGYDFVINRSRDGSTCTVERFTGRDWESARAVGSAAYRVSGSRMVIAVDAELVGLDTRDSFDFKWADNAAVEGNVMKFMTLGDTAPNDRFRFRYVLSGGTYSDAPFIYENETQPETQPETAAPATDAVTEADTAPAGRKHGDITWIRGLWIIFAASDVLLAALLCVLLVKRRKNQ